MNPNSIKKSDKEKDEFILADQHSDGVHFDKRLKKAKEAESKKNKKEDKDSKKEP